MNVDYSPQLSGTEPPSHEKYLFVSTPGENKAGCRKVYSFLLKSNILGIVLDLNVFHICCIYKQNNSIRPYLVDTVKLALQNQRKHFKHLYITFSNMSNSHCKSIKYINEIN